MPNTTYSNTLHNAFDKLVEKGVEGLTRNKRFHRLGIESILRNTEEMHKTIQRLREVAKETRQLEVMTDEHLDVALNRVLSQLVAECLTEGHPPTIDEALRQKALRELDWCSTVKIPLGRFWAFVHQCELERNIIDLDGPLRLRKATLIEKAYFRSQNFAVAGRTAGDVIAETMPTTKTAVIQKNRRRISLRNDLLVEFDYLVTILRLLSPSSSGVNLVIDDESPMKGSVVLSVTHNTRPDIFPAAFSRRLNSKCHIGEKQRKLLIRLLRKLRKVAKMDNPEVKRLLRSLRRYNRAIANDFIEDEVIDLSIILETIVRTGGTPMTSRIASITAIDEDKENSIMKMLRKVHRSIRGPLVHGASFNPKYTPIVDNLFEITCNALRTYIMLIDVREGLVEYLDRAKSNREVKKQLRKRLQNWIDE
jgi:hypothetical protein